MAQSSFTSINSKLAEAYCETAAENTSNAAQELRSLLKENLNDDELVDCHIAIDGTWQKRGYSSLNGVVAALANANQKVIDYHVMSKFCKGCTIWDKKKGTLEYDKWKEKHQCAINHKQSSGAMEAAGAITIFQSSIKKHKLRYSHYIGDGDTESFRKVADSKPYGDELDIEKLECIGHYQKRLGNRIRKKRLKLKGNILSDGKKIMGRGRLTGKAINTMQNYFGMARRQNKGKLYEMKKAIGAVLWLCSDIRDSPTFPNIPQHSPTFPNIPQHSPTFLNIPQHSPTFLGIPRIPHVPFLHSPFRVLQIARNNSKYRATNSEETNTYSGPELSNVFSQI